LSWQQDAASKTVTGALVPAINLGGSTKAPGGDDSTLSKPDNKKESVLLCFPNSRFPYLSENYYHQ
jgi:hypothetical protein